MYGHNVACGSDGSLIAASPAILCCIAAHRQRTCHRDYNKYKANFKTHIPDGPQLATDSIAICDRPCRPASQLAVMAPTSPKERVSDQISGFVKRHFNIFITAASLERASRRKIGNKKTCKPSATSKTQRTCYSRFLPCKSAASLMYLFYSPWIVPSRHFPVIA